MSEAAAQYPFVYAYHAGRFALVMRGFFFTYGANEVMAERGSPGESQRQRSEQRHSDRYSQGAEECARYAGDGDQRQEDHNRCDGRTNERRTNLADSAADLFGA